MYLYITPNDLESRFDLVKKHYTRHEEVPHYTRETSGMGKLLGVLEKVRIDLYYPTLFDKATYLLVAINKGHFFSNGNKRLALVIALDFLILNGARVQDLSGDRFEGYKRKLSEIFGNVQFEEYPEFTPEEFALYHLSLIVAESHRYVGNDFDALKQKVNDFFVFSFTEE